MEKAEITTIYDETVMLSRRLATRASRHRPRPASLRWISSPSKSRRWYGARSLQGMITLSAALETKEEGRNTNDDGNAAPSFVLGRSSFVRFTAEDTGQGIPADDLPHVFERFWRAERARAREQGGSGLGLAIARQIVAAHGGRIGVESRIDAGSQFWFRLPVAEPPAPFSTSAHQIKQSSNAR